MTAEKVREELEDVIVGYASDYERSEYLRDTKWTDVEKALNAYRDALQAPVPEDRHHEETP